MSADPPHSTTRVNSQMRPSETANVERSWPIDDGDERRAAAVRRRTERAQERERLEVDPGERDACLPAGADVAVDELAVRDDEQHALGPALPRRRSRRARDSRAPLRRAGSAALPARGTAPRSRAASPRRRRRCRGCGRRCGCSRCRAGRPSAAACASRRTPSARRRAPLDRAARPPTTMPGASGSRASCCSSATPLFEMRAAASCDAPIFRPTSRFVAVAAAAPAASRLSAAARASASRADLALPRRRRPSRRPAAARSVPRTAAAFGLRPRRELLLPERRAGPSLLRRTRGLRSRLRLAGERELLLPERTACGVDDGGQLGGGDGRMHDDRRGHLRARAAAPLRRATARAQLRRRLRSRLSTSVGNDRRDCLDRCRCGRQLEPGSSSSGGERRRSGGSSATGCSVGDGRQVDRRLGSSSGRLEQDRRGRGRIGHRGDERPRRARPAAAARPARCGRTAPARRRPPPAASRSTVSVLLLRRSDDLLLPDRLRFLGLGVGCRRRLLRLARERDLLLQERLLLGLRLGAAPAAPSACAERDLLLQERLLRQRSQVEVRIAVGLRSCA